jgi:hypothetical protein
MDVALEYLAEQEQQRAEGLVLCRCRDSVLHRQAAQEARHVVHVRLPGSKLARKPAEEASDPADVSLFGAATVVTRAQYFSKAGDELHPVCSQLGLLGPAGLGRRRRQGLACPLRHRCAAVRGRSVDAPPSTPPVGRRGERLERRSLVASSNHRHLIPPDSGVARSADCASIRAFVWGERRPGDFSRARGRTGSRLSARPSRLRKNGR